MQQAEKIKLLEVCKIAAELEKNEADGYLEKVQARLANQNIKLTTEQDDLKKELQRLESERQAALSPLDKDLLSTYEDLRQQRRGISRPAPLAAPP